jgi:hypothetical protein
VSLPDTTEVAGEDVAGTGNVLRVTRGGDVTPEELAALAVVFTAASGQAASVQPAGPPAWAQAALLEGIGARIVEEPAHLRSLDGVR